MLYPLPEAEYGRVRPLCAALDHHLAVRAAIERTAPARIYVDDPSRPTAALICARHRFYLAGSPHNERFNEGAQRLFADEIYPQARAAGEPAMFVLYYAPGWEESGERILQDKFPIRDERQYFVFRELKNDWRSLLPPGFTLRAVDRELVADGKFRNLAALLEEMCSERESVEDFLAHSLGVCVVRGDEIAGWCLSEYNSPGRCEVGIETVPEYRRQGLATLTASALVECALQQGIQHIGWHCWASNTASSATARKVGLEKVCDYPVYFAWFDEVDNLAVNGNVRFWRQEYRVALEWYERAFSRGEAKAWAYWNAACAYARVGENDAALGAIRQAVARGFRDLEAIRRSEHLQGLHGSAGWDKLLAELA